VDVDGPPVQWDHDNTTMLYAVGIAAVLAAASTINIRSSSGLQAHPLHKPSLDPMTDSKRGGIICAGLSCLDLQLVGCTQSGTDEAIERYDEAIHCSGGSASMTGTTLALLMRQSGCENRVSDEQVHILTKLGPDFAGTTLLDFYRRAGASTDLVLIDDAARTSMAVLPVFNNGKRGCFVNLACNDGFTADELLSQLDDAPQSPANPTRAFLFGYPHLMPKMQGYALQSMLSEARRKLSVKGASVLIGVDLNGVDGTDPGAAREALFPALNEIDVLHLNEDEAILLSSEESTCEGNDANTNLSPTLLSQISSLHNQGCAVILLSLGSKGAFVSVTPDSQRLKQLSSDCSPMALSRWTPGSQVRIPAFKIGHGSINANGAGDALFSGFCLAASSWSCTVEQQMSLGHEWRVTPQVAGTFASLVAWQRCDTKTRDGVGMKSATELMQLIYTGKLPDVVHECDSD
jgi:sugar/nucleoside kinase (ribokinase family)